MIVHPHDVNKVLSFSAKLTLRLYSDVVQDNVAARRRRLMYRDASVPAVTPRAAPDVQVFTSPVSVVVNGDASSASGLSVGAIAGIAVGCVAGIAALGVVVAVLVKRRKAAMIGESQVATDAEDTKLGQA